MPTQFDEAFARVKQLVADFRANESFYLSPQYQEQEARRDFIDKFWMALGWDVNHDRQKNPFEQEVKVERKEHGYSQRRADYAFYLSPNFRDVKFYVEAKKPHGDIATKDNYFQINRYGWSSQTPLGVLNDFEQFHIIDCRYRPDIDTSVSQGLRKYHFHDYEDAEKFAEIYWLFSREAVANGSLEKFTDTLPKKRGKAVQRGLFKGGYQGIDETFLEELDEYRESLAKAFKNENPDLDGETLTELTQRTLDRLVFLRFLEDKHIETAKHIAYFGDKGTAWQDFIKESRRLDGTYNGIVYKEHPILDKPTFKPNDGIFSDICERLSHVNSPYDFNAIPIHILGSIYERFLGKVITTTDKRAKVDWKPENRKQNGVYYTPEYIVRYIVENTVGKLIEGKSPAQISEMRFADIACGSGSFLLGVYDLLIRYHTKYYNDQPGKAKKGDVVQRDDGLHLSLQKKRQILVNNIYGVDIDHQAVEVAQLSLYLKLLQDETPGSTREYQLEFPEALLPSLNKNIICGNSLIGTDILDGQLFDPTDERKLNPMNFEDAFPHIFKRRPGGAMRETPATPLDLDLPGVPLHGSYAEKKKKAPRAARLPKEWEGGFDAIVGNPPWGVEFTSADLKYLRARYETADASNVDSYAVFVEKAVNQLKKGGLLGYIIPDTFLRKDDYLPTRRFFLHKTIIRELIETGPVFSQVRDTWCLVFSVEKGEPADGIIRHRKLSRFIVSTEERLKKFSRYEWDNESEVPQSLWMNRPNLIVAYLAHTAAQATIEKIESHPRLGTLKEQFRISRGEEGSKFNLIEKDDGNFFMLTPEKIERYEVGTGLRVLSKTLTPNKVESYYKRPKIWIIRIQKMRWKQRIVSGFDDRRNSGGMKTLQIIVSSKDSQDGLKYLQAILASKLVNYWCINFLADDMNQTYLEQLPIRMIDFDDASDKTRHDRIVQLVDQMLEAKKQLATAQTEKVQTYFEKRCASLDRQIDALVYELYGLTEEEIKIVEEATP